MKYSSGSHHLRLVAIVLKGSGNFPSVTKCLPGRTGANCIQKLRRDRLPGLLEFIPFWRFKIKETAYSVRKGSEEIRMSIFFENQNHLPGKSVFSLFLFVLPSDKFWYCRLSPNHKVLHYGDLEESPQGEVPHDSLQDKRKCLFCVGGLSFGWLFVSWSQNIIQKDY